MVSVLWDKFTNGTVTTSYTNDRGRGVAKSWFYYSKSILLEQFYFVATLETHLQFLQRQAEGPVQQSPASQHLSVQQSMVARVKRDALL